MSRNILEATAELYLLVPELRTSTMGASRERIELAQSALGVEFPPSYCDFLQRHGGFTFHGGFELAGLCPFDDDQANYAADVVRLTKFERDGSGIPSQFVVLLNEDYERVFYIDTSQRDAISECPVVVFTLGDTEPSDYADNFVEFLLKRLKD
jgi:hypothetical protein